MEDTLLIALVLLSGAISTVIPVAITWQVSRSLRKKQADPAALERLLRLLGPVTSHVDGRQQMLGRRGSVLVDITLDLPVPSAVYGRYHREKSVPPSFPLELLVQRSEPKPPARPQPPAGPLGASPYRVPSPRATDHVIEQDQIRPIVLRRETQWDRIGKLLSNNKEWQTGDDRFDRSVYIETTAPNHVLDRVLSPSDVRDSVLALLFQGWSRVTLLGTSEGSVKLSAAYASEALLATQDIVAATDRATLVLETLP